MSFLAPLLLFGLPLALLPVIIHLIHLRRRKTVPWAAMMFLLAARKMNKGFSKLRQYLILAARVAAVMALIFVVSRPLAGGLLGLTGGAPDTVIVLLDRSASMEQQSLATGVGKREAGIGKLARAIRDTVGNRSRLVLIDSARLEPQEIEKPEALVDHPHAGPTDTAADIPALLQGALDYISANQTGRTDVWVLSDLRQSDWDAGGGRWQALRGAFNSLQGVRFHILTYAQPDERNLGVTVERVLRRESAEAAELLLDVRVTRDTQSTEPMELPLRFVVNGVTSILKTELKDNQLVLQGHGIPIDKATKRGTGRVELPADASGADNVYHFVFDEPPVLQSVIVSADDTVSGPLRAALSSPADNARRYNTLVLDPARAAEIPWDETALVVWHAALPTPDAILTRQLENHLAAGRTLLFLPPPESDGGGSAFLDLRWGEWRDGGDANAIDWWRNDAGLLANTRDGTALPVGEVEVRRQRAIEGVGVPLARTTGNEPVLKRATVGRSGTPSTGPDKPDHPSGPLLGACYFLGTLPGPGSSSLARDGVVMFALLHRALNEGARGIGKAQQRDAHLAALGPGDLSEWNREERVAGRAEDDSVIRSDLPLSAGVVTSGDRLVALNRPSSEDKPEVLGRTALDELFAGLDYQILEDTLEGTGSLASEVWRTFLFAMALALLLEALLCMPARRKEETEVMV